MIPLFLIAVIAALGGNAWSQQVTDDAIGRVTDPSGAVIPNARVSIATVGTGETRSVKSGYTRRSLERHGNAFIIFRGLRAWAGRGYTHVGNFGQGLAEGEGFECH